MTKYSRLAALHSDIWFFHDSKRYNSLENAAFVLFKEMGFEPKKASDAATHVKKSYYFYDLAVENRRQKKRHFREMLKSQVLTLKILDQDFFHICGRIHAMWWKEFYRKKRDSIMTIPVLIFFQHLFKFKGINPIPALRCSKYLILAGLRGHNKRNKEITESHLTNYWRLTHVYKFKNTVMY